MADADELRKEIGEALEDIAREADYSQEDVPIRLRERLDTIKSLAKQAVHDLGG